MCLMIISMILFFISNPLGLKPRPKLMFQPKICGTIIWYDMKTLGNHDLYHGRIKFK